MSNQAFARALFLPLAFVVGAPSVGAQDPGPTFMVSFSRCDRGRLDEVVARERERDLPMMQSLVNDGHMLGYGMAVHQWADEWNVLRWSIVPDIPSGIAAYDESGRRTEARYPDDDGSVDRSLCPSHRDLFYQQVATTTNPGFRIDPDSPPTLALSFFQCDFGALDEIMAQERTMVMPVAQEMVNEGLILSQSYYVHTWGDEWNYVVSRVVPNLGALDSTGEEMDERLEARNPDDEGPGLVDRHCTAHKDNLYTYLMATTPRTTE